MGPVLALFCWFRRSAGSTKMGVAVFMDLDDLGARGSEPTVQ